MLNILHLFLLNLVCNLLLILQFQVSFELTLYSNCTERLGGKVSMMHGLKKILPAKRYSTSFPFFK